MSKAIQTVKQFLMEENGPTAVEYAVMVSLIVIAALVGINALGARVLALFNTASTSF